MTTARHIDSPAICYLCELSQVDDVRGFGGKSHNLAQMLRNGLPVFPGFVVSDRAFQEFLRCNELCSPISDLCDGIDWNDPVSIKRISADIKELVVNAVVPDHLAQSMYKQWQDQLSMKTLIVRSSAVGEDSQQASFAGQLDSILDVDSKAGLLAALRACWASYWSDRSLFYQHRRGIPLQGMGVLIQEQAQSKISGVLFTVSPDVAVAGGDSMIVEYCSGFGSALVSGEINPGRLALRRHDASCQVLAKFDDSHHGDIPLSGHVTTSLVQFGLALEQLFEGPQDIEWTLDQDDQLYLLQSRDISVQPPSQQQEDSSSDVRLVLWSNANVNENFPEPISPLLYSIASDGYYHYFRNLGLAIGLTESRVRAMEEPLRQIIGVQGARMYYNLSSIHACLRMAPFGDRLTESFNSFVGATEIAPVDDGPDWHRFSDSRFTQFGESVRIALASLWRLLWLSNGVTRFERTVDSFATETNPDRLSEKTLAELHAALKQFLAIRCHRWLPASLADAAAMLSYGMLKRFLNHEFPDQDLASLHNTLLKGLPDLASNQPVIGLWELSRQIQQDATLAELFAQNNSEQIMQALDHDVDLRSFRDSFAAYLEDSGFRCSGELMLTVPSFQEDPAVLVDILKAYASLAGESPADRLLEQEQQRQSETLRVMKVLKRRAAVRYLPWPKKSWQGHWLLQRTQRAIALRERARLKQALLYSRCRRIVLAIGEKLVRRGLLEDSSDIFFLTHQEIDELLAGSSMFPRDTTNLVRLRKSAHQEMSRLTPPDTFVLPAGTYYCDESQLPDNVRGELTQEDSDSEFELRGVGACGGTVTASAAILKDVSQFHLLGKGDVLVTRQTDPGWGPLFFLIEGLVIERGGMLSHGAILAREYGIPTVVGVPDATDKITHGQTLTVNGDRGIVQLPHQ